MRSPDRCVDPAPNEQLELNGKVATNLEDDMLECQGVEDIKIRSLSKEKVRR